MHVNFNPELGKRARAVLLTLWVGDGGWGDMLPLSGMPSAVNRVFVCCVSFYNFYYNRQLFKECGQGKHTTQRFQTP